MKRNKTIFLLTLFVLAITAAHAQVAVSDVKGEAFGRSIHGLGFSGGPASGIGIQF